jgi:glycolate oxidase FAD binding subunit
MADLIQPADEDHLASIIAGLASRKVPVAIAGGNSRRGYGRPVQSAATIATTKLSGITQYEPSELFVSALAGTPLDVVEAALSERGQRLAFEPMDHRVLLQAAGTPTIGGVAAANVSGPRRVQVGAARDSLIGIRAVTGRGDVVKSGGRVMKNVTGYDLVKFLAGSFGTLAVLTEVTFKVAPVPESEVTVALPSLDDASAVAALSAALGSPFGVTAAAHLPAFADRRARTLMRLEGFRDSVAYRAERIRETLAEFGAADILPQRMSETLWRAIRDLDVLDALGVSPDMPVWRISVKPSEAAGLVARVRESFDCSVLYDWGGGLVWIAGGVGLNDAGAAAVREATAATEGHATLMRAPETVRAAVPVFQPLAGPIMELSRKLKASFDPTGILNPGRIYAGM